MKRLRILLSISLLLMVIPLTGAFFVKKEPDMEDLVLLQLMTEANPDYEEEALCAQAVLIRTNLVAQSKATGITKEKVAELLRYDSTGSKMKRFQNAVHSTKGWILKVDGKVRSLPYHRCSCGTTRAAQEIQSEKAVYLKSTACPDDVLTEGFLQIKEFPEGKKVKVLRRFKSGYVETVKVRGKMTGLMSGEAFRKKFDLPSSCFYIRKSKGRTYVITKGIGHGFGLSQSMADTLAKQGKEWKEIIRYFFKNTKLSNISQNEE